MKIRLLFAWYDLWVGAYWDRKTRKLYILPLPCTGVVMDFGAQLPVPGCGVKEPIARLLSALKFFRENEAHEIPMAALATDDTEESIGDLIDAALREARERP